MLEWLQRLIFSLMSNKGKYTDSMRLTVSDLFQDFLSLIYPRYCMGCQDGLIKGEEILCTKCIHELPKTHYHQEAENPIFKRLYGRIPLSNALAFLLFRKGGIVQHLLHELKYNNHPEIGLIMGTIYGEELLKNGYSDQFDCVLPIPLHPIKQRRRGYNQSEEFAIGLANKLGAKHISNAVIRVTKTETQTQKSKLKRWENVKQVFKVVNREAIEGKRVLLVDDVITTGATVEACGQALLDSGCSTLSVAGIAYAEE